MSEATVSGIRPHTAPSEARVPNARELAGCVLLGTIMGITLVKGEIVSWFRIQEMFRFQSPHMYLIMASAIVTAMIGLEILRRTGTHALNGQAIALQPKVLGRGYRYWIGGSIFGLGWGLTGACPGPLFALLGTGVPSLLVVILGALAGTWLYGMLRPHLPH
jgi:uncharacterized membrane protein YedE/YeeE